MSKSLLQCTAFLKMNDYRGQTKFICLYSSIVYQMACVSSLYSLHKIAADLAVAATSIFLSDIRLTVSDDIFAKFLNLKSERSLALVIDVSGSMRGEIIDIMFREFNICIKPSLEEFFYNYFLTEIEYSFLLIKPFRPAFYFLLFTFFR